MREVLCYTKVFIPFLFSVPCPPVCKSEAIGRGIAISIVKILNLYIILLANLGNSKQKMTYSGRISENSVENYQNGIQILNKNVQSKQQ